MSCRSLDHWSLTSWLDAYAVSADPHPLLSTTQEAHFIPSHLPSTLTRAHAVAVAIGQAPRGGVSTHRGSAQLWDAMEERHSDW